MRDCPYSAETDPAYVENVLEPLAKGEGVACFLAEGDDGEQAVLFFTHTLSGAAARFAIDVRDKVRAAQAVAVQRAARSRAETEGFSAIHA
jgi:hypothetical protein